MEQPAGDDDEDELDSLQPYTDKSLGQLIAETENWLRDGSPLRESTPRRFKAHLEPRRFILFPPRARAARNPFPHPHHTIAHSLSLSVRSLHPLTDDFDDLDEILRSLQALLTHLAAGELTPDQTHQVTYTAMPKFVTALLKTRLPSIKFCDRLNEFCQVLLRATVEMLNTSSHWELIECTARVLSDLQTYPLYNTLAAGAGIGGGLHGVGSSTSGGAAGGSGAAGGAGGAAGSANSGGGGGPDDGSSEGSDSEHSAWRGSPLPPEPHELGHEIIATDHNQIDEISPYYLHNIRYFHHLGGFQAILHRIQREPRVSFNGVRLLLRPFLKVRLSPHFCACGGSARSSARSVCFPACVLLASLSDTSLPLFPRFPAPHPLRSRICSPAPRCNPLRARRSRRRWTTSRR